MNQQNILLLTFSLITIAFLLWGTFGRSAEIELHASSEFTTRETDSINQDQHSFHCSLRDSADPRSDSYLFSFPFPKLSSNATDDGSLDRLCVTSKLTVSVSKSIEHEMVGIVNSFCSRIATFGYKDCSNPLAMIHIHDFSSKRFLLENVDNVVIQYDHPEFYEIMYDTSHTATVLANNKMGISHALTTISQHLFNQQKVSLPYHVIDWPENNWRGILIDVSRHFQPMKLLKRCIDGMVASKLNRLHLHLTDSQSFPILLDDIPGFPLSNLAKNGSFDATKMYTKADLKALVAYAAERSIEIIPEIDMPAHALSWGGGFKDVIVRCKTVAQMTETPHNIYPLDPSNPLTFELIKHILTQIIEIFPSKYLHVGGDEVNEHCWSESARVLEWTRTKGIQVADITRYFEEQVFAIVYKLGKVPIVWQGILDAHNMPKERTYRSNGNDSDSSNSAVSNSTRNSAKHPRRLRATEPEAVAKDSDVLRRLQRNLQLKEIELSADGVIASASQSAPAAGASSRTSTASATAAASPLATRPVVQPWKCWGGLALRAATASAESGHPSIMSACWYLDFNTDWTTFLATDITTTAHATVQPFLKSRYNLPNEPLLQEVTQNYTINITMSHISDTNIRGMNQLTKAELELYQQWAQYSNLHQNYFLGGEASLWTEHVDATNFECRIWPRTGAIAARLWGLGSLFANTAYYTPNIRLVDNNLRTSTSTTPGATSISTSKSFEFYSFKSVNQYSSTQRMELTVEQTKLLYASFIRFRYYLVAMKIAAAPLIYHRNAPRPATTGKTRKGKRRLQRAVYVPKELVSVELRNESHVISLVDNVTQGINLASSGLYTATDIPDGAFRLTSQCLGIPEQIQRPLTSKTLRIVQLNVADGSTGTRGQRMLDWLQTKANLGVFMVGFCELNGWERMESTIDLMKNRPQIVFRAANAGFSFSHVMVNSQPYNVGIVSIFPFTVLGEYGPPVFQRGLLHVYVEALQVHVMIAHLHAHSATAREEECRVIASILAPLLKAGKQVIVMGDFNTLSPYDQRRHEDDGIVSMMQAHITHPILQRWSKKYLTADGREISFAPMEILLQAGMRDACVEACRAETASKTEQENDWKSLRWSKASMAVDVFSQCMLRGCAHTEPTAYNPEWSVANTSHPEIRLDYILISPALAVALHNTGVSGAGVEISNVTTLLSDHFPVYANIPLAQEQDLF